MQHFHLIALFLSLGVVSVVVQGETNPTCSLTCSQRGTCKIGVKKYAQQFQLLPDSPFLKVFTDNNNYCECSGEPRGNEEAGVIGAGSKGYTGINCDTPFEVCPDGQRVCYHGSTCVASNPGDKIKSTYYCDCRPESMDLNSIKSTSEMTGTPTLAGVACEYEATSFCGESSSDHFTDDGVADVNDGTWFCTNNATCDATQKQIWKKCACTPDYFGPHCEYHKATAANFYANVPKTNTSPTPVDIPVPIPNYTSTCSLPCQNDGQCRFGIKDYSDAISGALQFHLKSEVDGMHCTCKKGYTGVLCDMPLSICPDDKSVCLNGADCLADKNEVTGQPEYFCDCASSISYNSTNRTDFVHNFDGYNSTNRTNFAGTFCEVPASVFCDVPVNTANPQNYFCTNGGRCAKVTSGVVAPYCICPAGFTGPRCEFKKGTELEKNCTLQCQNGGLCYFGAKDYFAIELLAKLNITEGRHINGMFCQCPPGFAGLMCDKKMDICSPKEQRACFNGATCFKKLGASTCNCTSAGDGYNRQFAGEFCQHQATSWCTGTYATPNDFCTNGGTCAARMNSPDSSFPGCNCPVQWTGEKCEVQVISSLVTNQQETDSTTHKHKSRVAAAVLVPLAIVAIAALVLRHRQKRRRAMKKNIILDLNLSAEPPFPSSSSPKGGVNSLPASSSPKSPSFSPSLSLSSSSSFSPKMTEDRGVLSDVEIL